MRSARRARRPAAANVLAGALAVAVVGLALLVLRAPRRARPGPVDGSALAGPTPTTVGAGPARSRRVVPPGHAGGSRRTPADHGVRSTQVAATSPASSVHLVRVRGSVRLGRHPVADRVVTFHALGSGAGDVEVDWDFTDALGRFDVRLPSARYAVQIDGERLVAGVVDVPAGVGEHGLRLDLAGAPSDVR